MLDGLRVRGLAQVSIHVSLSLISMLAVALSAVRLGVLVWLGVSRASLSECVVASEEACLGFSMVLMVGFLVFPVLGRWICGWKVRLVFNEVAVVSGGVLR